MSKQIEVMKLALDALLHAEDCVVLGGGGHLVVLNTYAAETVSEAITALREALAEQPDPDYAWAAVQDYEADVGFKVNDAFQMGWHMARTTNDLFKQMGAAHDLF